MQVSTHLKILVILLLLSGVASAACYLHTTFITGSEGALSKEAHDCDDGGIVANNPTNPEMAGMEVTDARLVNLPEKTRFDISRVIKGPPLPKPSSKLRDALGTNSLELVNPELGPLIGDDGYWNQNKPVFGFKNTVTEETYTLAELPASIRLDIQIRLQDFINVKWTPFLGDIKPDDVEIETIFQLDPNQLLTVSGGYKVVLRRLLDGWHNAD